MATNDNNFPIETLIAKGLKADMHEKIIKEALRPAAIAINKYASHAKDKMEEIIREEVEKYTVESVERLHNILKQTEEIGIKILYKGDITEDIKTYQTKLEKVEKDN